MLSNFVNAFLCNLLRNKVHSLVNIAGLSPGITCALIIFLIIKFELSFDKYHSGYCNTYRLVLMAMANPVQALSDE